MTKILTVFGASGRQGGSIIKHVLEDPKLSQEWKIRACTREPSGTTGKALAAQGAEVVAVDLNDVASIKNAVEGAWSVFAVTFTAHSRETCGQEIEQGKAIADACLAAGVNQIIWSTSVHTDQLSNYKYTECTIFNNKADVEDYVRTLPIKQTYYGPASFMQNYIGAAAPRPSPAKDGSFVLSNVFDDTTLVPLIDVASDTGKWIVPVLQDPDKYDKQVLKATERFYTLPEIAAIMSKATGKTVKYVKLPDEVYKGFLPPQFDVELLQMSQFMRDFGYYGPGADEKVAWSSKQAKGNLVTFEEFLAKNPLKLETPTE